MKNVIGLFGVCGNTTWRKDFINEYDNEKIAYFNPQVDNWNPELAKVEADHLVSDSIILFPITAETYAIGSLAETGFAVLSAYRALGNRSLIMLIDDDVAESLKVENPALAKESKRARALVKAHMSKITQPHVHMVNTMEEMLNLSISIYKERVNTDNLVREL